MSTNPIPEEEREYLKYFKALLSEVKSARTHYNIWKSIINAFNMYNPEVNEARVFFSNTEYAHRLAALTHGYKIFFESSGDLNILRLLNHISRNLDIFSIERYSQRIQGRAYYDSLLSNHIPLTPNDIRRYKHLLRSKQNIIDTLIKLRNKKLAHIDLEELFFGSSIYPIPTIDFEQLLSICFRILSELRINYDDTILSIETSVESELNRILESVRNYRQEEILSESFANGTP